MKKSQQNWTGCTRHKLDIWNLAGLLEDEITGKLLNGKSRNLDYSNWLLKSPKHQPPYLPRLNQRLKIKFRLRQASVFTMDIGIILREGIGALLKHLTVHGVGIEPIKTEHNRNRTKI